MSAILQRHVPLDQSQEGFVHHCGGLKGVAAALSRACSCAPAGELLINEGRQPLQGLGIAVTPVGQ